MANLPPDTVTVLRTRARDLIGGFSAELPPYEQVPAALVEAQFVQGAHANVELFFDCLETGEPPDPEKLATITNLALERLRDGVPLETVLATYRAGATYIWGELERTAGDAERDAMRDVGPLLMQYVAAVTAHVAVASVEHVADPLWEQRDRRRAMIDALLEGRTPREWMDGVAPAPVADSFLVVVFYVAETASPVLTAMVRNRLDRVPGTFARLDRGGWTALVPIAGSIEDAATRVRNCLTGSASGEAATSGLWIGVAPAVAHGDIPAAAADARTVAAICRRLDRHGEVTRPHDVLVHFALARGVGARRYLTDVIGALRSQPVLDETLTAFFDCDFNQIAAARRLGVHRNTVTYRLSGITALTGYDPLRPREAMVLLAAQLVGELPD
jgi:hypothetical protein